MTLFGTILKKVQSQDSIAKKYSSPPPEKAAVILLKNKRKHASKYGHVRSRVDSAAPALEPRAWCRLLAPWRGNLCNIYWQNVQLLQAIKRQHFLRGKVDCRWSHLPEPCLQSYHARRHFHQRVQRDNEHLYQIITNTKPRVTPTECLRRDWARNRRQMIEGAENKFVLFDPKPQEHIEDAAFKPPVGVKRPRKVPGLYWSGGDVIHDNGFGCYAQRGRRAPIGAENYHFSHSMPGLLSMRMTRNNEMCGIFNITFKALPQFDLRNVVFGRVIRPCSTYDTIRALGSPLSTRPVVTVSATRRCDYDTGRWVCGQPNSRLIRMRY